jgi:hypothetical protein
LNGDVVDPAGQVEARVIFYLYGREGFIGDPNIATIQSCAGRNTLGFDTSNVQIVTGGTFGG